MDRSLFTTLLAYTFALLLLYLLYSILSPFLGTMVWAGAIGVITFPIYTSLLARCNGRDITAAALMTGVVVLAVILPLIGLIFTLSREAALAYQYLENFTASGSNLAMSNILNHPAVIPWLERLLWAFWKACAWA